MQNQNLNIVKEESDYLEDFNGVTNFKYLSKNQSTDFKAFRSRSRSNSQVDLNTNAKSIEEPLPRMGGGRDYPSFLGESKVYIVTFDGPNDPIHPHNWKLSSKLSSSLALGFYTSTFSIGSALFAECSDDIQQLYNVGKPVAALCTSLFVFGFAFGPLVWGPLSELFGRKIILILSSLLYTFFCFADAVSKDIQSIIICRYFEGFLGAAAFVACPAAMTDLFNHKSRGNAIGYFVLMVFSGPIFGPIISGFIVKNPHLGWRWSSYIGGIMASISVLLLIFLYKESHHPIILVRKAEILRRRTKNWAIHAAHEETSLSVKVIIEKYITRPVRMLFTEPIIFLITLYNAFIYGILYLCITAIPLIFMGEYKFSQGVAELPYLAMLIGILIGYLLLSYMDRRYISSMERNGGDPIAEERLPPMQVGGFFFAGGLFWLCWTGQFAEKFHWIVPSLGLGCVGIGLVLVFIPCMNYVIDCYLHSAASALAAMTLLRSSLAASFPLFSRQMFDNMQIKWAGTLLGCFAILLIPVPFLFYKYGSIIRGKSKYAFVL